MNDIFINETKGETLDLKLAVLIDADNIPYAYVKGILSEIARYGTPAIKRIYGDWTRPELSGWKNVLLENAISPIQQYSYTTGKNSTDSAMIIDAMDILYEDNVDGFCIVSSDSDFTRLSMRLRESGKRVIGLGERKTPTPFIVACDKFIFLEILESEHKEGGKSVKSTRSKKSRPAKLPKNVIKLIEASVDAVADEDGWAFLGEIGNIILKKEPSFDARNYGYAKLTPLIEATELFEIDRRDTSNRGIKHIYIRNKNFSKNGTE